MLCNITNATNTRRKFQPPVNNQGDLHFEIGSKGYNAIIIKQTEFIINEFIPLKFMRFEYFTMSKKFEMCANCFTKCNKLRARILSAARMRHRFPLLMLAAIFFDNNNLEIEQTKCDI